MRWKIINIRASLLFELLQIVANYIGVKHALEYVPHTSIHWAGGRLEPPPDTPHCGFDGALSRQMTGYAILILF
ncbi:hypothetical protein LSTR_LSTR016813 [Laodelphax striatellus]|uniref:Uncharacterized protein n=1 Tax=Laodelphax striatellus TaxID=195883 RepID=A0A482WYY4_LAOST|nr:hypothetical protein LSTR_LSTR016813 [Laodelphax striatellus]